MSERRDADGDPLPEIMALKPDRMRWLATFLISAGLVATAAWLGPGDPVLFWGAGGVFVLCGLVAAPLMFGAGANLKLDRQGFACRTLFRSVRREWRECSAFYPVSTGVRKFVGFSTTQDGMARPDGRSPERSVIGASGMLPDTFGLSAEDLSDLLNRFRVRAMAA